MSESREIRILLTSVGRRVELVQAFHAAAERLGVSLTVFGADITEDAPALLFCDRRETVCRIADPDYIPQLLALCKREGIHALIPTIDTDLLLLSRHKADFALIGTEVLISAEDKVALCRDKRLTADFFIRCGLRTPRTADEVKAYDGGFPAFIKPKDGSSSINAYRADTQQELAALSARVSDYIIQPFIEGTEYTVDAFCDFDGNPLLITPRVRLAVRSGEVLKTRISQDSRIISEAKQLLAAFKPCGQITVQLIRDSRTGEDYYIEINPRFGGGAPLSIKAGADSAELLLRLLCGERLSYRENAAEDGAVFSRFDQSVRVQ